MSLAVYRRLAGDVRQVFTCGFPRGLDELDERQGIESGRALILDRGMSAFRIPKQR